MDLILGSASPRRREILGFFSLPFNVAHSPFDESKIVYEGGPEKHIRTLSEGKGSALLTLHPRDAILTADTLVVYNDQIFGQPKTMEKALAMLQTLCGNWHTVMTAVTLTTKDRQQTEMASTRVLLQNLTEKQMHRYIRANNSFDKAGAYAIQDRGSLIVEKIEGCFYNVMGLPIQLVATLLRTIGVDIWDYLDSPISS